MIGDAEAIWLGLKAEKKTNSETGEETVRIRWIDGMVSENFKFFQNQETIYNNIITSMMHTHILVTELNFSETSVFRCLILVNSASGVSKVCYIDYSGVKVFGGRTLRDTFPLIG